MTGAAPPGLHPLINGKIAWVIRFLVRAREIFPRFFRQHQHEKEGARGGKGTKEREGRALSRTRPKKKIIFLFPAKPSMLLTLRAAARHAAPRHSRFFARAPNFSGAVQDGAKGGALWSWGHSDEGNIREPMEHHLDSLAVQV